MKSTDGKPWTEADVSKMIANPIYAGIGPYPAMISDAQWIDAAAKLITEKGAKHVLREILANLRDGFPSQ